MSPKNKNLNDPFLMKNMNEAVELLHKIVVKSRTMPIKVKDKVDCDTDGYSSSAVLIQFLNAIAPNIKVDYQLNFEKRHGLTYDDMLGNKSDEYELLIIPDASMTCEDARLIKNMYDADILVLDHHIIENEFYKKSTKEWISRDEAKELYKSNKEDLEVDCYTNYCLAVNCHDGQYPNNTLSGVGVVQKFIEAYMDKYGVEDKLDPELRVKFLDLVSLGIIADSMDVRNLETRYYALEGLKPHNRYNELLNEFEEKFKEEMKFGRTITSIGWVIAPEINGVTRYGKEKEQIDLFRAMLGEQETIEYQPRRKSKNDPKPPLEYNSLQKTMARVSYNVKQRQDTEVRKFVKKIEEEIQEKSLDKNSILFVDGTSILTKNTVTGLVANKLTSKYFRPVVLLKSRDEENFGGSCRGYEKGKISSIKDFLQEAGMEIKGHDNAAGCFVRKDKLQQVIDECNKKMPIEELCTIHTVDWEISAEDLKKEYVQEVAENYAVFGNTVPEPLFAITDLKINASLINGYGENNGFIRFVYNGITFVKKYCSLTDYDVMTLNDRRVIGKNKKELKLNLICQFVLNSWEDKINPEVKILYFDSNEIKKTKEKTNKKIVDDDDFDW